ncbi:MAG: sigma-70 family RNA polymerase sigma factor [Oscillochloris sp.]|nr:sigma-70 family RNA polymerase sigma factor [Oscillochloris sp.]
MAYQAYLKITGRNLAVDLFRAEARQPEVSLDNTHADSCDGIADAHSDIAELEQLLRFEAILGYIRKPLDREIFRLRFGLHLSPDETVADLALQGQDVTKSQVFRSVERTIRYLGTLPDVRELFEL